MSNPIVNGPRSRTYARTTRLARGENGVAYDPVDVAMMTGEHKQSDHLARHPSASCRPSATTSFRPKWPAPSPATSNAPCQARR
jgi:hypothetical protein